MQKNDLNFCHSSEGPRKGGGKEIWDGREALQAARLQPRVLVSAALWMTRPAPPLPPWSTKRLNIELIRRAQVSAAGVATARDSEKGNYYRANYIASHNRTFTL
jgi:hypothetical protein